MTSVMRLAFFLFTLQLSFAICCHAQWAGPENRDALLARTKASPSSAAELLAKRLLGPKAMHRIESHFPLPLRSTNAISMRTYGAADTAHLEWTARYASGLAPTTDIATAVALDASGNVYVTGYSTHLPYGSDMVTIKYKSSGVQEWLQRYAGNPDGDNGGVAVAVDASGNLYAAGYVVGIDGSADWTLIKYSPSGALRWKTQYAGPAGSNDVPVAMKMDPRGDLVVTGYGDAEYVTIKYDSSGVQRWIQRYKSSDNANGRPTALAIDSDGNIYVTGSSGMGTQMDYATVKYDAQGNQKWIALYDGPAHEWDSANGVAVDDSGNVYVTGRIRPVLYQTFQIATVKYDANGLQRWVSIYSAASHGDTGNDVAVDHAGNVYVVGESDSLHFPDGVLLKYGPEGNLVWKDRYDSREYDEFNKVVVDRQGSVYVIGWSQLSTTDLYQVFKYDADGTRMWVARYNTNDGDAYATAIEVDSAGSAFVTGGSGYDSGAMEGYDYSTVKYSPAEETQWAARYAGTKTSYDIPSRIAADEANVYVAGESRTVEGQALCAIKYSAQGSPQWAAQYIGPVGYNWPVMMKVDNAGNVYVVGASYGINSNYGYVTIKYDSQGNERWAARYEAADFGDNYPAALEVDQNGNVIVTGSAYADTNSNIATVKYSPEGAQLWVAQYPIGPSSNDTPRAMALDSQGNIYLTGGRSAESLTIKYSSDGTQQWAARYKTAANVVCWGSALAIDGLGNVYVTGFSDPSMRLADCFTLKYNALGKLVWSALYNGPSDGNDYGVSIALDARKNVYVGGNSTGESGNDLVAIKYGPDGAQQWVARYDAADGTSNWMEDVVVDGSGNLLVTGTSNTAQLLTVVYDPDGAEKRVVRYGPGGCHTVDRWGNVYLAERVWGAGWSTIVLAKYTDTPFPSSDQLPTPPVDHWLAQNYPNPFNGSTVISFALTKTQKVTVRVYDLLGRSVVTLIDEELDPGDHFVEWKAEGVSSGVYFYRLQAEEFAATKRMLVIR